MACICRDAKIAGPVLARASNGAEPKGTGALKDDAATRKYAAIPEGQTAESITQADLASFLLDQLVDESHRGTAVTVANV